MKISTTCCVTTLLKIANSSYNFYGHMMLLVEAQFMNTSKSILYSALSFLLFALISTTVTIAGALHWIGVPDGPVNVKGYGDIDIFNHKIIDTEFVNPLPGGVQALRLKLDDNHFTTDGFALVNRNGKIIDDYDDLFKQMEAIKDDADETKQQHSGQYITAPYMVNDSIYFISNYDAIGGELWQFNTTTRKLTKVLSSAEYGDLALLFANKDGLLVRSSKWNDILKMDIDHHVEPLNIGGKVWAISHDGHYMAYQLSSTAATLDATVIIRNVSDKKEVVVKGYEATHFYNGGGTFNHASTAFACLLYDEDTRLPVAIYAVNIHNGDHYYIHADQLKGQLAAPNDDSLTFVDDDTLTVQLTNHKKQQFKFAKFAMNP